jgi:hypothetical protein
LRRDATGLLLSLLRGFVLAVALSRFDQRKQLIVDEANAIGTAQLRAYRLPASAREKMLGLLREYVGARTRFAETRVHDQGFDQAIVDGQQLHNQMWRESVEVAKTTPNAITSLFIQSLNDAIYAKSG